jgi:hypothetical protein
MERSTPGAINAGRVTLGAILLTLGLLMLLNRAGYFDVDVMRLFPGAVLIAIGITRMVLGGGDRAGPRGRSSIVHGLWLTTVGAWLIVNLLHLFGLTFRTSWPLLLIAAGAFIVARAQEK